MTNLYDNATEYTVVIEEDYLSRQMVGAWTYPTLHHKLSKKLNHGEEIDFVTTNLWIRRDKGGCPITTYHLYRIGE